MFFHKVDPLALDLNGNTLAEAGSYTDEDGKEHIMGDLHLAADRQHSRYSNSIPLTDEQRREVYLREAAAQSSELAEVLQQYKNAATKEEQLALRDKSRSKDARRSFTPNAPNKTLQTLYKAVTEAYSSPRKQHKTHI